MNKNKITKWLLFIHQLPVKPSNLRVKVWRRLQQIGALQIKGSVYVLPRTKEFLEDFQWLKQEIIDFNGEASIFAAEAIEDLRSGDIIALFNEVRDRAYRKLIGEFKELLIRIEKHPGKMDKGLFKQIEKDFEKIAGSLETLKKIDFFDAPSKKEAGKVMDKCIKSIDRHNPLSKKKEKNKLSATTLKIEDFKGKTWVTRKNLHIDRLVSGWLIKRFIDPKAKFVFVDSGNPAQRGKKAKGIPFDMFDAEFSHHGEDCTFETMIKRFSLLEDRCLKEIAEIVHDIDIKDNKFNRSEAQGINRLTLGWGKLWKDDERLLKKGFLLFDGLYAHFKE